MSAHDLLVEIGTEELPTFSVLPLTQAFAQDLTRQFKDLGLQHNAVKIFAAPRRMAMLVEQLATSLPSKTKEHRGPPVTIAFNEQGDPTPAAQGFADRFNVAVNDLEQLETPKGTYLIFNEIQAAQNTRDKLIDLINNTLMRLPIKKPMSWGNQKFKFARPVHWALVLFDNNIVPGEILGQAVANVSYGHRFHCDAPITLKKPTDYANSLATKGFVLADYQARKKLITEQIAQIVQAKNSQILADPQLLEEVTCLVEWPVALLGEFDAQFLNVPTEVISTALKQHQKSFTVLDENGALAPYFITIANIESKDPLQVIKGNEKVVHARLSDAAFFYQNDRGQRLESRLDQLGHVIFEKQLGSLLDKSHRISTIAKLLASDFDLDAQSLAHAGMLCKADLTSDMVGEFPELQGIMGAYYAEHDQEAPLVSQAIREHYQPRSQEDSVPNSLAGAALALADKFDTLAGIFAIDKKPTGDKDPYALRRAALGLVRICIEKKLNVDLHQCFLHALAQQPVQVDTAKLAQALLDFTLDRLNSWLREQTYPVEIFAAIKALHPNNPYDIFLRADALKHFVTQPEANHLALIHKRVNNILKKQTTLNSALNTALLKEPQEQALAQAIAQHNQTILQLCGEHDYKQALITMAGLKDTIDDFFDNVLVNCDDAALQQNRITLLKHLSDLFLQVADLSYLHISA